MKVILYVFFFLFTSNSIIAQVNPNNIEIVREYGTPHIFGQTDEEVAFGLAWAHAEDDLKQFKKHFLPSKSLMGHYQGKEEEARLYISIIKM